MASFTEHIINVLTGIDSRSVDHTYQSDPVIAELQVAYTSVQSEILEVVTHPIIEMIQ